MNIKVMSKEKLIKEIQSYTKDICVISIQDPNDFIKFQTKATVLYLKFHDVENVRDGMKPMSNDDGKVIANFVLRNEDCKIFIVSCEAGVSRSSGTAGAILKFFTGDDSRFFKSPYYPNMNCYRLVYNNLIQIRYERDYKNGINSETN